jgi:hypothetical protein
MRSPNTALQRTHSAPLRSPLSRKPLTSSHDSKPQGIVAGLLSIPTGFLFKGVAKKALLQDLNDIKSAVEQE